MEQTLKGSPNQGTERQKSQSGVGSIHKRKEEVKWTNQKKDTSIKGKWTLSGQEQMKTYKIGSISDTRGLMEPMTLRQGQGVP